MQLSTARALGRLDSARSKLDSIASGHQDVAALVEDGKYAQAAGRAESELERDERCRQRIDDILDDIEEVLEAAEVSDGAPGVQATDEFVWDCRDCGFTGDWLTVDGCCPECGGRDLPTLERDA
ncbi:hypothetical protein HZS55_15815 [Halosimplex rubrum]|uniref:Uncharacterized protein n=1 Tax=Halosimplex rubrum TaxID=869889 RepID=A0A7D5P5B2_9EURY|nr:hypothetical protein [Halosimplex rubrum]QLH78664.1 hypothetical protein HZS55_15815 [Halosimplex rubrum]